MTTKRKECHEILNQISNTRLHDTLKMLKEIRDRIDADYANYLDGIPVYDLNNKLHLKRIVESLPQDNPTIKH